MMIFKVLVLNTQFVGLQSAFQVQRFWPVRPDEAFMRGGGDLEEKTIMSVVLYLNWTTF